MNELINKADIDDDEQAFIKIVFTPHGPGAGIGPPVFFPCTKPKILAGNGE